MVMSLPPEKSTMVDNQRTARELSKVEPSRRAEVLEKAAAAGPVTAKSIKAAAGMATIVAESPLPKDCRLCATILRRVVYKHPVFIVWSQFVTTSNK